MKLIRKFEIGGKNATIPSAYNNNKTSPSEDYERNFLNPRGYKYVRIENILPSDPYYDAVRNVHKKSGNLHSIYLVDTNGMYVPASKLRELQAEYLQIPITEIELSRPINGPQIYLPQVENLEEVEIDRRNQARELEEFNRLVDRAFNPLTYIDPSGYVGIALRVNPLTGRFYTGNAPLSLSQAMGDWWLYGNDGIVTDNYAKENPITAQLANTAFDLVTLGGTSLPSRAGFLLTKLGLAAPRFTSVVRPIINGTVTTGRYVSDPRLITTAAAIGSTTIPNQAAERKNESYYATLYSKPDNNYTKEDTIKWNNRLVELRNQLTNDYGWNFDANHNPTQEEEEGSTLTWPYFMLGDAAKTAALEYYDRRRAKKVASQVASQVEETVPKSNNLGKFARGVFKYVPISGIIAGLHDWLQSKNIEEKNLIDEYNVLARKLGYGLIPSSTSAVTIQSTASNNHDTIDLTKQTQELIRRRAQDPNAQVNSVGPIDDELPDDQ